MLLSLPGSSIFPCLSLQGEAEAIMHVFNSVLMSVGATCIRQMQRAVQEVGADV